jgi:hypothetical protein
VGATSALALATGNGESLLALTTRGMSSMIGGWRGVLGTPPATTLGNGCASVGTPPRSSLHGIVPPDWARLTLADAPPGAFASVVVDLRPRVPAPAPIALDPWGLTGCSLYALPQLVCPHMVDATGYASQVLPRTVVAPTAGLGSVHAQWVLFWFGPQGIEHAVTQALALVTI